MMHPIRKTFEAIHNSFNYLSPGSALSSAIGIVFRFLRTANILLPCIFISVCSFFLLMRQPQILESYRVIGEYLSDQPYVRGWLNAALNILMFETLLSALCVSMYVSAVTSFRFHKMYRAELTIQTYLHYPTAMVAILPAVGVSFGIFNARIGSDSVLTTRVLLLWSLVTLLIAILMFIFLSIRIRAASSSTHFSKITLSVLGEIGVAFLLIFLIDSLFYFSWSFVGALGVFLLFLNIVTIALSAMYSVGLFTGVPIITLLLCAAISFTLIGVNDNHELNLVEQPNAMNQGIELSEADAFTEWLSSRTDLARYAGRPYPVFIAAAEGGGIFAAVHTALTLGNLSDRCHLFQEHLFAVSAVSGGSLGAAAATSLMTRKHAGDTALTCDGREATSAGIEARASELLMHDFLTPVVRALVFGDVLQSILPFPIAKLDRANALEESISSAWDAVGNGENPFRQDFLLSWSAGEKRPAVVLNATDVVSGDRIVFAPFRIDGPSHLAHFPVASRNVSLATAVVASARFPWISPAGWAKGAIVEGRDLGGNLEEAEKDTRGQGSVIQVVDGGYVDNSGLLTALDIAAGISHAAQVTHSPVDIYLVQIDQQKGVASPPIFSDFVAPFYALIDTRGAQIRNLKRRIRSLFQSRLIVSSVSGRGYPLPLTWQMSNATLRTIKSQVEGENECKDRRPDTGEDRCILRTIIEALRP